MAADEDEIDYLIAAVNRYFKEKLRREDVIMSFSGVRPLFDDGKGNPSAVTRDYVFDLDETGGAPLLNVFGGKITTFRELAERGMHRLDEVLPRAWAATGPRRRRCRAARSRTPTSCSFARGAAGAPIPGCRARCSTHYARQLRRAHRAAWSAARPRVAGLGRHFGAQLYEAEVRYLVAQRMGADAGGRAAPAHQAGAAHDGGRSGPPSPPGSTPSWRRPPDACR